MFLDPSKYVLIRCQRSLHEQLKNLTFRILLLVVLLTGGAWPQYLLLVQL